MASHLRRSDVQLHESCNQFNRRTVSWSHRAWSQYHQYHNDVEQQIVLSVTYLGYAVGLLLFGQLSEVFGRLYVMHAANLLRLLFNSVSGNAASLIVCRFFAGVTRSAPLAVCYCDDVLRYERLTCPRLVVVYLVIFSALRREALHSQCMHWFLCSDQVYNSFPYLLIFYRKRLCATL